MPLKTDCLFFTDGTQTAMKKISTPYTFSLKVFPYLYFAFILVFVLIVLMGGALNKDPVFIIVPCVMAVMGHYFLKVALQDLVDEVFDCGDFLLVRKRGQQDAIQFSNIINVNFAMNQKPARITLTLDHPGKFGSAILFALPPKTYLSPLPRSEVAEDLIARAHAARTRKNEGQRGVSGVEVCQHETDKHERGFCKQGLNHSAARKRYQYAKVMAPQPVLCSPHEGQNPGCRLRINAGVTDFRPR